MSQNPADINDQIHKSPRLYIDTPLSAGTQITLDKDQSHYLINVLRKSEEDALRVFNGKDGEWTATITAASKKSASVQIGQQLRVQPQTTPHVGLIFSPIKKHRMDFLIEKAVELGVTDLYPALMQRTENRKIKPERIKAQIIEAAEQCERLTIPALHECSPLNMTLNTIPPDSPIYWAAERFENSKTSKNTAPPCTFLIGPEGGFDQTEKDFLIKHDRITPITLGNNILRAETAALHCLSQI